MNLGEIYKKLKSFHLKSGVPYTAQTNVVSPLFPGQFNYCLDEVNWYKKYGDFVAIDINESFQKIQPAIRLADLEKYFIDTSGDNYHLAQFSISTINGAHVVSRERGPEFYRQSVRGVLDLFVNYLGLEKHRLYFSYFPGGVTARSIEASRKKGYQLLKVEVKKEVPPDELALNTLLSLGIKQKNLIANIQETIFLL